VHEAWVTKQNVAVLIPPPLPILQLDPALSSAEGAVA